MSRSFANRKDAGQRLATRLEYLRDQDVVVLGLPRGGVPVAFEVASALDAPLDVIVVRKLGVPFQPELAMGAIGEDGARVLDSDVIAHAGVRDEDIRAVEEQARHELERRVHLLRTGRRRVVLTGRTVVIVDDGLATGSTARAACQVARHLGAGRVVVAVPVAPDDTLRSFVEADEVVCLEVPRRFTAVGAHYRDFAATSDDEVARSLDAGDRRRRDREVEIPVGDVNIVGNLRLPPGATGIVVFAHGSGSSWRSPRNRYVADVLNRSWLGALLLDLLTDEESELRANVFDIELLANRLVAVTRWLRAHADTRSLRVGYFGASTGAGAALWAAGDSSVDVAAVVSRGGRPDLAGPRLALVRAPTLLIVGGADLQVLALNRSAQAVLRCPSRLEVVAGATHLFEEPGTLAQVADLAADWFAQHLVVAPRAAGARR
jgi:putative phosphoribosyl transferase